MNEPSTFPRVLGIYLNDHAAGATGGAELARRTAREHRQSAFSGDLEDIAAQIMEDREALLDIMADLRGCPYARYKASVGGWLGEKAGRLKPNGPAAPSFGAEHARRTGGPAYRSGGQGDAVAFAAGRGRPGHPLGPGSAHRAAEPGAAAAHGAGVAPPCRGRRAVRPRSAGSAGDGGRPM
ncbi:LOW QUALITY PROTEIN: conserved hypothetical protein, partial [Streptomyces himastatinicus ATCC 53653]